LNARNLISGGHFRRDVKLAQRRGKEMSKLRELILLLAKGSRSPVNGSTTANVTWNQIGC
jgi:mRNA-degrading endonuclease YafQ of YafQ-DinJ toxin-antitoxin module